VSAATPNERTLLVQVKQLTKGLLISSLLNAALFSSSLYLYMREYPVALIAPVTPPRVVFEEKIEVKAPFIAVNTNENPIKPVEVFRVSEKKIEEKIKPKIANTTVAIPKKQISNVTPPIEVSNRTYHVKQGDTLWKVAKKLNVDIVSLRELNNIQTDLKPGTVIKIPISSKQ